MRSIGAIALLWLISVTPAIAEPLFGGWSGLYLGGHLGGAWGSSEWFDLGAGARFRGPQRYEIGLDRRRRPRIGLCAGLVGLCRIRLSRLRLQCSDPEMHRGCRLRSARQGRDRHQHPREFSPAEDRPELP